VSTSRRGFLKGLVGVSAGAAAATKLTGCAPNVPLAPVVDVAMLAQGDIRLEVARYPELAREGGAISLRLSSRNQLLVMHLPGNVYKVVTNSCTHSGCPLGFQDGEAVCPCHGSRFTPDGQVLQPPAKANLGVIKAVVFDAQTGVLTIRTKAGDEDFPALQDGKVVFSLLSERFAALRNPGGYVQGVPEGYGQTLFVFALEDGTYRAVDSLCTHQGCEVAYDETLYEGMGGLLCPCHVSLFRKTGEVTEGPALDTGPLRSFQATREGTDVVVLIPA
jgi:Rieske Fe-S protein